MRRIQKHQLEELPKLISLGYKMISCTSEEIYVSQSEQYEDEKFFIGVGGIILQNDRYLLVQEANGPIKEKWGFPSGLLNKGELICDGLIREIKEETNLNAKFDSIKYVGQLVEARWGRQEFYFGCKLDIFGDSQIVLCNKELLDYKWVLRDEMKYMNLTPICRLGMQYM